MKCLTAESQSSLEKEVLVLLVRRNRNSKVAGKGRIWGVGEFRHVVYEIQLTHNIDVGTVVVRISDIKPCFKY